MGPSADRGCCGRQRRRQPFRRHRPP
jgi:hypothetical protein